MRERLTKQGEQERTAAEQAGIEALSLWKRQRKLYIAFHKPDKAVLVHAGKLFWARAEEPTLVPRKTL